MALRIKYLSCRWQSQEISSSSSYRKNKEVDRKKEKEEDRKKKKSSIEKKEEVKKSVTFRSIKTNKKSIK